MLSQSELETIARNRLADAEALLGAERFDGAAYLCGYAVEIGLKLRICKTLRWSSFPEKDNEFNEFGLNSFKTHRLNYLLRLSGIEDEIKSNYLAEWSVVNTWKPESRYNRIGTMDQEQVSALIDSTKKLLDIL